MTIRDVHRIERGGEVSFVIAENGVWLPGSYATERAATMAFDLPDRTLAELQWSVNPGGTITEAMLEGVDRPRTVFLLARVVDALGDYQFDPIAVVPDRRQADLLLARVGEIARRNGERERAWRVAWVTIRPEGDLPRPAYELLEGTDHAPRSPSCDERYDIIEVSWLPRGD